MWPRGPRGVEGTKRDGRGVVASGGASLFLDTAPPVRCAPAHAVGGGDAGAWESARAARQAWGREGLELGAVGEPRGQELRSVSAYPIPKYGGTKREGASREGRNALTPRSEQTVEAMGVGWRASAARETWSPPLISDLHVHNSIKFCLALGHDCRQFEKTTKYISEVWNDLTEGDASTPDTNEAGKIWHKQGGQRFGQITYTGS
ncbi:hypothetical protein K438DRAFT_1776692 [Mycena galopus ATCC 62051]|nr:hypothetical protein K438DRAFT_1776692 [Mycena galopus ATCC 62051]